MFLINVWTLWTVFFGKTKHHFKNVHNFTGHTGNGNCTRPKFHTDKSLILFYTHLNVITKYFIKYSIYELNNDESPKTCVVWITARFKEVLYTLILFRAELQVWHISHKQSYIHENQDNIGQHNIWDWGNSTFYFANKQY